jgi:hypothetical protein
MIPCLADTLDPVTDSDSILRAEIGNSETKKLMDPGGDSPGQRARQSWGGLVRERGSGPGLSTQRGLDQLSPFTTGFMLACAHQH